MSYHKITLLGNVGQDPELRYTAGGTPVTNLSIATKEQIAKERDGQAVPCPDGWGEYGKYWTQTTWWKGAAWRGLAELIGEHVHKGDMVYVEGKIGGETTAGNQNPVVWQAKDGTSKASYELTITTFKFAGKGGGGGDHRTPEEPPGYRPDIGGDDIPF